MPEEDCGSGDWRMWKIGSGRIRDPSNDRDPGNKCLRSIQQLSFWIQGTLSFGKGEGLFVNYVTQIRVEGLTLLFCQGIKMGRERLGFSEAQCRVIAILLCLSDHNKVGKNKEYVGGATC